jgi:pimeloyl-ACP methyl ester carboxylesterase
VTVYFISGLGADKRAFEKLTLPQNITIKYVEWVENSEEESLAGYCHKLCDQINTKEDFSLVGLSFGGIVAVELAKIIKPKQVILISSIATSKELPIDKFGHFLFKKLHLYKFIPAAIFKNANAITYWFFGVKKEDEKQLLKQIIADTPPAFAKWAFGRILTWENTIEPQNLFHIHGTADKLFPIGYICPDVKINGGGHFMVYSKADEISEVLARRFIR